MSEQANPKYTIDDVVDLLKQQVDLSTIGTVVNRATQTIMTQLLTEVAASGRGMGIGGTDPELTAAISDLHKTVAALPSDIALEHDAARGAREQNGVTSAFDRPNPVIIVGPKPLQVTIVGGLPGQSSPGQPPKAPTPKDEEPGFLRRLWNNSRVGKASGNAQKSVGSLLGGKGPTGLGGLTGVAAGLARLAGPIGAAVAFGDAVNQARKAIIQHMDVQLAAARKLSDMSASMAVVMANRDIQELLRERRQGDAQSGSARSLAQAEQRRKDAGEGLENHITIFKNELLALLNDTMVPSLQLMSDAVEAIANSPIMKVSGILAANIEKRKKEEEEQRKAGATAWGTDMGRIEREARRIEEEAARKMAAARDAAISGRIYPAGGRLP